MNYKDKNKKKEVVLKCFNQPNNMDEDFNKFLNEV
jgi:hypothetical protein